MEYVVGALIVLVLAICGACLLGFFYLIAKTYIDDPKANPSNLPTKDAYRL